VKSRLFHRLKYVSSKQFKAGTFQPGDH